MIYILLIAIGVVCFVAGMKFQQDRMRFVFREGVTYTLVDRQWRDLDAPASKRRARLEVVRD